jgi:hypothetical protein
MTRALGVAALFLLCLLPARAQQSLTRPKVEVKVAAGGSTFILTDDTELNHKTVGGAVRVYLSKHWSFEPEFTYMRHGRDDQDFYFIPNVAYDFGDPAARAVLYAIAGVGGWRHEGRYDGVPVSGSTWTLGVGGGIKIFLTDRLFVAPEVRFGHEPALRGSVSVGYVLWGRSKKTK